MFDFLRSCYLVTVYHHIRHHLAILVACIVFCVLFPVGVYTQTEGVGIIVAIQKSLLQAVSYIPVHREPLQITSSYTLYCTIYFLTVADIPKLFVYIANSVTYLLQANGSPLPLLALDPLPVAISPSLPLTTTRQCSLEVVNQDVAVESMTATLWILHQWYGQTHCDSSYNYNNCTLSDWDRVVISSSQ